MRPSNLMCFGSGMCYLLSLAAFGFQPAGGYHLLRKVPLGAAAGGGEYFDYITFDAAARRVYLSHGTEVKILDADTTGFSAILAA